MKRIAFLAVTAALTLVACTAPEPLPRAVVKREFVCLIHDKLSERHVGVDSAWPWGDSGLIRIEYTEGAVVYYRPRQGESCGVEDYG